MRSRHGTDANRWLSNLTGQSTQPPDNWRYSGSLRSSDSTQKNESDSGRRPSSVSPLKSFTRRRSALTSAFAPCELGQGPHASAGPNSIGFTPSRALALAMRKRVELRRRLDPREVALPVPSAEPAKTMEWGRHCQPKGGRARDSPHRTAHSTSSRPNLGDGAEKTSVLLRLLDPMSEIEQRRRRVCYVFSVPSRRLTREDVARSSRAKRRRSALSPRPSRARRARCSTARAWTPR